MVADERMETWTSRPSPSAVRPCGMAATGACSRLDTKAPTRQHPSGSRSRGRRNGPPTSPYGASLASHRGIGRDAPLLAHSGSSRAELS